MKHFSIFLISFVVFLLLCINIAKPEGTCHGTFVDPITNVCWSCLFPISIGSMDVVSSSLPDTDNPSSPICACGTPIPRIGITTGFWEPIALVDVTRTPYCMVNLGGVQFDMGGEYSIGDNETSLSNDNNSFYYVHWYKYPLLFWLNIITDWVCIQTGDFD